MSCFKQMFYWNFPCPGYFHRVGRCQSSVDWERLEIRDEILAERIGNDTVTNKINPKHYSYLILHAGASWGLAQSGLAQPAWTIAVTA